ncbi:MAG: S-adenosylmethionine:tRNA ribosyltransferase-isomerase [Chloroflexota bacterium]|nr:MAG: S-adenosylmethionine:tRNA ribosyltransferase-isomerase [Chloroflexota bacterium]
MNRSDLLFDRPEELAATRPAEPSGRARDAGRLLVSDSRGHRHGRFANLADFLEPGDLLVINRSATLPASLPAKSYSPDRRSSEPFTLNLSTNYGAGLWLAEPRISHSLPGPVPGLSAGDTFEVAGVKATLIAAFPDIPRLWFVQFEAGLSGAMRRAGQPIRYAYVDGAYGLEHYQTLFSSVPGSAEMPSAGYPFTGRVVQRLVDRGVRLASIVLHTGVSSLEVEVDDITQHTLYPEPYEVSRLTARAVNETRDAGRRVIAVGTTVVRALESAWDGQAVRASSGFTRLYIHPGRGLNVVDGLLTGLHDPLTSHLAMLYTLAGQDMIRDAYNAATGQGYRWHEFGDSHLILPGKRQQVMV